MGTDICMYVERWEGDRWCLAVPMLESKFTGGEHYPESIYTTRDYALFTVLAGVRGHRWENRVAPIVEPRGLPKDLSPELQAYAQTESILERPSWLLLSELLAFDWYGRIIDPDYLAPPYLDLHRTYAEFIGEGFIKEVVEPLAQRYKDPEVVRLVFWFSS